LLINFDPLTGIYADGIIFENLHRVHSKSTDWKAN